MRSAPDPNASRQAANQAWSLNGFRLAAANCPQCVRNAENRSLSVTHSIQSRTAATITQRSSAGG